MSDRHLLDWLIENEPSFRKSRLPSLYSDLAQQKTANPDGFAANYTAWLAGLSNAALAGRLPLEQKIVLECSNDLLDALSSREYGRPDGLGIVFDEAVRSVKMVGLKEFMSSERSIYHKSWIPSLGTVLTWGLRQAGFMRSTYNDDGRLKRGQLVLVDNLEQISKRIETDQAQRSSSITSRVLTKDAFTRRLKDDLDTSLSKHELEVLLRYLQRDKGTLVYDEHTVKFRSRSTDMPEPLTKEDASIASLSALIFTLTTQIEGLNTRIDSLQQTAKDAVERKNKQAAVSALRSKKLAEQSMQSRTDTLYKLQEVYTKIEEAADQVAIVNVMRTSAETLKSLNSQVGGVETVDQIMDDLREKMTETEDVGRVLQEPLTQGAVIDDGEIDDEFEAMRAEEVKKIEDGKAEAARKKEMEVDAALASKKIEDQQRKQTDSVLDDELANSSKRLDQLKLDDSDAKEARKEEQAEPAVS